MSDRIALSSGEQRRAALLGVAVVIVIGATWGIVAARRHRAAQRAAGTAGTPAMQGMKGTEGRGGMGGMNMTASGSVKLTAAQIRQFGITFGTVDIRRLTAEVRTTGVITVDETKLAQVAPKFERISSRRQGVGCNSGTSRSRRSTRSSVAAKCDGR